MSTRGYTLIELIVVIILIGVVAAGAGAAYVSMGGSVDVADARNTVTVALSAQQQRHGSRGAFTDSPARLARISPEVVHVPVANDPKEISTALGTLDGAPAVAAVTRVDDTCVGGIVIDPAVDDSVTGVSWERTASQACTGAEAFDHLGEGTW